MPARATGLAPMPEHEFEFTPDMLDYQMEGLDGGRPLDIPAPSHGRMPGSDRSSLPPRSSAIRVDYDPEPEEDEPPMPDAPSLDSAMPPRPTAPVRVRAPARESKALKRLREKFGENATLNQETINESHEKSLQEAKEAKDTELERIED